MYTKNTKLKIYESDYQVKKITIVMLIRNNSPYLKKFFQMAESLESTYEISFDYVFIENGSTDNSIDITNKFISDRNAKIIILGNTKELDSLPRIIKMTKIRNYAKHFSSNESDWTILIDSNIYFESNILEELFKLDPSSKNIGMLCAYGVEVTPGDKPDKWLTQFHYYDTFAFVSLNNELFWPNCIFSSCHKCQSTKDTKIDSIGLIDVKSAFGGFSLIKSDIFKDPRISYDVLESNNKLLCEHISFCLKINEIKNKKICIATNCLVYWDASTFGN